MKAVVARTGTVFAVRAAVVRWTAAPASLLWVAAGVLLLLVPFAGGGGALSAQVEAPPSEPRMLAEAQRREASGDVAAAESILRDLLDRHPTSTGALFAYERILRRQGRVEEVLPVVDAFLRVDAGAAGAHLLKVRVLVEADSLEAARAAADAWIDVDPTSPEPYREVAAIFESAFGPDEALEVLRRGSSQIEDAPLLAVETGDVLLRTGNHDEAVREWSRALGDEGAQLPAILQRLEGMSSRDRRSMRPLVGEMEREPTTPARLRAAAQIAVEVGLEEEAMELSRAVLPDLSGSAGRGFLVGLARQAEENGMERLMLWVYRTMREESSDAAETLALDRQIVGLAASVGDTAVALAAQERIATGLPDASADRRRAAANAIRLSVPLLPPEEVQERLERFRSTYPRAPELDDLAANLARTWMARGDRDAARSVLQGIEGPRSALDRAYLAFEGSAADPEQVTEDLRTAVDGLPGEGATEVIQLLALMSRVGDEAALLAGRAAALAHRGEESRAVELLTEEVPELPEGDRPPLLALGARIAGSAGAGNRLADEKVDFLTRLVDDFAESPEAPDAMLQLARHHLREGNDIADAAELLETLILTRPDSPVVPDARRELQRLRQQHPGEADRS